MLAFGAFIGGKAVNSITEANKDRLQMRDSVTRLAIGVESISGDLRDIRGEINKQVGELKVEIHEQVSGLKQELHQQQLNHDQRMAGVETRIDGVNSRIDVIAASEGSLISRPQPSGSRLEWERRCMAPEADTDHS